MRAQAAKQKSKPIEAAKWPATLIESVFRQDTSRTPSAHAHSQRPRRLKIRTPDVRILVRPDQSSRTYSLGRLSRSVD